MLTTSCKDPALSGGPAAVGDSAHAGLLLETLNLHASAINIALQKQLALETQVEDLRARLLASPAAVSPSQPPPKACTSGRVERDGWLEAALDKSAPTDEKSLIYFFHIPKTSGASFQHFLIDAFGEGGVSPLRNWNDVLANSARSAEWKVWSGHFVGLLPFILPSWPRMVTILRDPIDRAISNINHWRRDTTNPLQPLVSRMGVLEFCHHRRLRREVDNLQARSLASLSFALLLFRSGNGGAVNADFGDLLYSMDPQYGLLDWAIRAMSEMDMVGIAETHHASLRLFARKFDLPEPAEPYYDNKSAHFELKRTDLSPLELECLQELNQIDQLVYGYARKRFETECREADLAVTM